jgi:hypothetical protein
MQTLLAVGLALLFLGFLLGMAVGSPARGPQQPTVVITQPQEGLTGAALAVLFIAVVVLILLVVELP